MTADNNNETKQQDGKDINSNQKPESMDNSLQDDAEFDMAATEAAIDEALVQQQNEIQQERRHRAEVMAAERDMYENMSVIDEQKTEEGLPCLNCNTPLRGPYCHECGQPERHFIRFFPRVLWDMINEAFDLDSRLFRTLMPLMFRPGKLTVEYIAGRRASYINPLRMYIVISLVFFLVISLATRFSDEENDLNVSVNTSDSVQESTDIESSDQEILEQRLTGLKTAKEHGAPIPEQVIRDVEYELAQINSTDSEKDDDLDVTFEDGSVWHPTRNPLEFNQWFDEETTATLNNFLWQLKDKTKMIEEDPKAFFEEVLDVFPALMFLLLPVFAVLLKVVYIFKKRYYMEHLIIALHSHSFIFFNLLIMFLLDLVGERFVPIASATGDMEQHWVSQTIDIMIALMLIWMPINLFLQQKRVYAQGKIMTTIKFIMVGAGYAFMLLFTVLVAAVLGLVNL